MKNKYRLVCASGALAATLTAGIALTACDDGFGIVAPSANAENVSTCPEITWTAEPDATLYHMGIATDGAYENVVSEGTTAELTYTVGNALAHATQYYLRVNALKEEEDKTVLLNSAESRFKTEAAHATDAPDYTAARTLYDFESFSDDGALREEFPRHVDGNELGVSLVEGGVNGSKAMQIDYTAGNKGWAGVTCKLPADKKVWSGAKGIRMWVKGEGLGTNIEVRIGKRGYQSWAATFSVNNADPCYVSIPFSAFEDIGGGDGIWDLAGITRFWLFFTGSSNSSVIIDDIMLGSDENYTTDTRSEIETRRFAPAGVYDNFDGYANDDEMEMKWTFENMGQYTVTDSPFSTGKALELGPQSAYAAARLNLPNYDFTQLKSIHFKASAGTYVLQLETKDGGVFEKEPLVVAVNGDRTGVNIADLVPRAGTEGGVKFIRQLVIGVKDANGKTCYVDDLTFSEEPFVAKDYTPKVGVLDDFEAYADVQSLEKVWTKIGTIAFELVDSPFGEEGKALKLQSSSAWGVACYTYPNVSFAGITSIRFKATTGAYKIRLVGSNDVSYTAETTVRADGDEAGFNLARLTANDGSALDITSIKELWIELTHGIPVIIDDLTFSDETFTPKDYTAGLIENFEEMTNETAGKFWKPNALANVSIDEEANGNKRLKIENTAKGQQTITLDASYFSKYDYTKTIGFRFKFSTANNVPEMTIQFGSYLNVYTISRQIYGAANNVKEIVVMYDAMKLADGSSGALDKAKVNYMVIYISQWLDSGFAAYIDDFEFLTAETYTPEKVMVDDFESYADDAALQAAWHANNVVLDNGAMKVTTASGWNGLQYNFTAAGGIGSEDDFQNCYAISFDVTASVDLNLIVKLQRWGNAKETMVSVKGGETTHVVVYFNQLTLSGADDWSDMIFNYLTFGLTYYGVTDITFDNVAFLRG